MYKVLLVDDEILVREAISENINWAGLGFELVKVCENGKEAMEYVKQHEVDLVLTDICMPYADGMELSKYVYEQFPQTKIVIFSGYGEFEYAKQAIKYKVAEYILKPVTARELSEVLSNVHEKLEKERKEQQQIDKLSVVYKKYTKNEAIIVSKAMSHLVKGTKDLEESLFELKELGVNIRQEGNYAVAVIDIDIYSDLYEITEGAKKESALMAFAVENISNEIVVGYEYGFAYRDDDNRVCILYYSGKPREFRSRVFKISEEVRNLVFETMKLNTSVGIGKTVRSPEELHISYSTALKMLDCRYTKGGSILLDCEDINDCQEELAADFEKYTARLSEAIKSRDESAVKEKLNKIEEQFKECYMNKHKAVAYLHQILRVICETVNAIGIDLTLSDGLITAVSRAGSLVKAMQIVEEYAGQAMRQIGELKQSSGEYQAFKAMDYLRENYAKTGLSLNDICSYLNISTSHFSSIFKEAVGGTFTEVLTGIRMEKAKQLLRETSLKNYEIAERVGFSDPHYFSITFKKITGMTPKEYVRENS